MLFMKIVEKRGAFDGVDECCLEGPSVDGGGGGGEEEED